MFEADSSEEKPSPSPQLVGSGNEEYCVCRGKEQVGINMQSGCLDSTNKQPVELYLGFISEPHLKEGP